MQQPAALRVPPDNPPGTNYFVDMLNADVKRLVGPVSEDLTLRSTLDLNLQSIAEGIVSRRLKAEGRAKKVTQAALVAMAPDGAILAMVGGRDYNESQFNRVTQAKRQPGSLFKLFVYLTAFQRGATPQTTMIDRPVQIGNWEPENHGGGFRGQITLRTAFASSVNSVAAQLGEAVGIPAVIETARKLGVQSELPAVPSLALGSGEVTLLEMTRAFAAIAANAENVEPYAIREARKGDQAVFTRPRSELQPASDPSARGAMRDVLTAVVRDGTGRAARINGPAAGKTGTSQSYRDAWFIGFTSGIVVGVWVGNDDNSPTRGVTGGDIPARIWNEFVTQSATARAKPARPQTVSLAASGGSECKARHGCIDRARCARRAEYRYARVAGARDPSFRRRGRPWPGRAGFQALSRAARGGVRAGRERQRVPMQRRRSGSLARRAVQRRRPGERKRDAGNARAGSTGALDQAGHLARRGWRRRLST